MCQEKEDGGLGTKCIDTKNACLLLKLLHRLHHPEGSAWAAWADDLINMSNLHGELCGTHWVALRDLLPAYQQITRVTICGGYDPRYP